MNKKKWFYVGVLALLPFLIFITSVIKRRSLPPPLPVLTVERVNDFKKRLETMSFDVVEDTPEFKSKVESITIEGGALLTGDQNLALRKSLYSMIMAFHYGTYEAYRAFRTPITASFNPQAIIYHRYVLTNFCLQSNDHVPNEAEEIVKLIWAKNYGGNAFINYWKGLCVTNVQIRIDMTNNTPSDLFHYAMSGDSLGVREIMPTFIFPRTPSVILKTNGKLIYATLTLDIKPNDPDPSFPVFFRCYWDDQAGEWLPWEMSSGNTQKRKRDPMF